MTKTQVAKLLVATLTPLVGKTLTKEAVEDLVAQVGPKSGGFTKRDISEIIKVDANGKTIQIFDTVAKVWLPATPEFFYEDKKNPNPKLNGLKNHSKAREKLTKEHVKHTKMAKDVVWKGTVENDVLDKAVAKQLLSSVPAIDYTRIQPNGEIKPTQEIAKFEAKLQELAGKIESALKPKSTQTNTDKQKTTPAN
jgi:ABC-type Zn2+ transport system substrate-binding protein/surface adhesin